MTDKNTQALNGLNGLNGLRFYPPFSLNPAPLLGLRGTERTERANSLTLHARARARTRIKQQYFILKVINTRSARSARSKPCGVRLSDGTGKTSHPFSPFHPAKRGQ